MGVRIREFPAFGGDMIFAGAAADALTGTWYAIFVMQDATFSTITEVGITRTMSTADLTSITFGAGSILYGAFTNFTLTAGAVRAYNTE